MRPSGASVLLAQKTAREFQRLPDLHDDTAAASAAHQAGGLEGQSRVRDEGQHEKELRQRSRAKVRGRFNANAWG